MSSRTIVLVLSFTAAALLGCSSQDKIGTPKADVLNHRGTPKRWAKANRSGLQVVTLFDINAAKQPMPTDEVWMFEYAESGKPICITLEDDKVTAITDAACLKQ